MAGLCAALALGCGDAESTATADTTPVSGDTSPSGADTQTSVSAGLYRSDVPYDPTITATPAELAAESEAAWDFTARLYRELGASTLEPGLISPYSVRAAFGMLRSGATGAERDNLDTVLGFAADDAVHLRTFATVDRELGERNHTADGPESMHPDLALQRANALFCELSDAKEVRPLFLDRLSQYFDAGVRTAPVRTDKTAAKDLINAWVSEQTHGKIPALLPVVDEDAWLVLVNALYFKASWDTPFTEGLTEDGDFAVGGAGTVSVPMMHHDAYPARYAAGDDYVAVALPYSDDRLELVVVLPNEGEDAAFAAGLTGARLRALSDALQDTIVDLKLPKLTRPGATSDLLPPLKALGLTPDAQYTDVHPSGPMILQVFHQVFLAMDEKGTEAAAATAIVMGGDGDVTPDAQVSVVVNRPYYLFIHDRALGVPLVFGRINDPSS